MPKILINYKKSTKSILKKTKVIITKDKETPKTQVIYKSTVPSRQLKKKPGLTNANFELPKHVELESFDVSGMTYFINWDTGYIFPINNDDKPKPIGQLIEHEPVCHDKKKYPLINREINWFYYYDLDIDVK